MNNVSIRQAISASEAHRPTRLRQSSIRYISEYPLLCRHICYLQSTVRC